MCIHPVQTFREQIDNVSLSGRINTSTSRREGHKAQGEESTWHQAVRCVHVQPSGHHTTLVCARPTRYMGSICGKLFDTEETGNGESTYVYSTTISKQSMSWSGAASLCSNGQRNMGT